MNTRKSDVNPTLRSRLLRLREYFLIIVPLGVGLLGYVAGEMAVEDPALKGFIANAHYLGIALAILGVLIVIGFRELLASRHVLAVPSEG